MRFPEFMGWDWFIGRDRFGGASVRRAVGVLCVSACAMMVPAVPAQALEKGFSPWLICANSHSRSSDRKADALEVLPRSVADTQWERPARPETPRKDEGIAPAGRNGD